MQHLSRLPTADLFQKIRGKALAREGQHRVFSPAPEFVAEADLRSVNAVQLGDVVVQQPIFFLFVEAHCMFGEEFLRPRPG